MASTLLLQRDQWDLAIDATGNIALATDPYSIIQDVASACRLFFGELWFDTSKGVRYWQGILGRPAPLALLKSQIVDAAISVPGVASATVQIGSLVDRKVTGQISCVLDDGSTVTVSL